MDESPFVDVVLPVPIPRMFTYKVPKALQPLLQIGCRVLVQFGKKKVLTGIIGRVHHSPPQAYEAKPVLDLLEEQPSVNPLQIRFWVWMASYYCCHIGEVMGAALPSGLRLTSESKIQLHPEFDLENSPYPLDVREEKILEALATKEELSYEDCEQLLGVKAIHPILKSLVAKEAILIFEKVQEKYSPKIETRLRLHADYLTGTALEALFGELQSKPKQEAILLKFLRDLPVHQRPELNTKGLPKASLLEEGDSESSLKTLIKNGVLESYSQLVDRIPEKPLSEKLQPFRKPSSWPWIKSKVTLKTSRPSSFRALPVLEKRRSTSN